MNTSTCEELGTCSGSGSPDPLLVLPVLLSVLWVIFDLLYASSLAAFVVNRVANLFLKDSGIYIGALRISLLSGRILFKDVHYYCRDYSIRVTDGYVVFRWWSRRKQKVCSKCASCGSTEQRPPFIFSQLNGVEWHWYNRSDVYDNWGQVKIEENTDSDSDGEESAVWNMWKEMQPSLHFSMKKGRFIFGNHLLEKSLVLHFDRGEAHYSTVDASNPYDELMHEIKWHGLDVRLVLEPSAGWEGGSQEKPPITCDGVEDTFPLIRSNSGNITYSFDSPGLVPLGETRGPKYAFDVVFGENTVINYGAYSSRQRAFIQKMFFPNDYVEEPPTKCPEPGEKRTFLFLDVSFKLTSPAALNIHFRDIEKKEVIQHLAVELGSESMLSINQPWTTGEDGYVTVVSGRLLDVRINSSLEYPLLAKAETVEFKADLHFPRPWNATQTWDLNFTASKAQVNVLFSYIDFINAFLEDWQGTDAPDLLSFVPLLWRVTIDMRDYEIFLFTNRYNWIDVAMDGIENTRLAICGTTGQMKFELPFTEFLPPVQRISFTAAGENIVVRQYISPSCSTRESIFALSSSNSRRWRVMEFQEDPAQPGEKKNETQSALPSAASITSIRSKTAASKGSTQTLDSDRDSGDVLVQQQQQQGSKGKHHVQATNFWVGGDGASASVSASQDEVSVRPTEKSLDTVASDAVLEEEPPQNEFFPMGCRVETHYENGWLDIACGPSIFLGITYHSHLHDVELVSDLSMKPNVLKVEADIPTVLLRVFGHLGRILLALKENYPGEYTDFKAFNSFVPHSPPPEQSKASPKPKLVDRPFFPDDATAEFKERFLDIFVDFRVHNITFEFPTHLPEGYPPDFPLPSAFSSELSVLMDYLSRETKVRMHLEPLTVHLPSTVLSPSPSGGAAEGGGATGDGNDPVYELGTLGLTGLDFNCHGFTEFLCQERVEYGWLMQLLVGRITGAVCTEQLLQVVNWLQTTYGHVASYGDSFIESPNAKPIEPDVDPFSEIIKYRLFDLTILEADLHLLEGSTVTRIQSPGFDLDMCTLHSAAETLGLSLQLQGLTATSYLPSSTDPAACMLECGLIDVGNVQGDLNLREREECVPFRQREFLKLADGRTRRLWFLWKHEDDDRVDGGSTGRKGLKDEFRCGCCGGCPFLGGCIERQLPRDKLHSVAYVSRLSTEPERPEKPESGSASTYKSLGLQTLRKVLPGFSIKELDCVQYIHQGLLEHYAVRYGKPNVVSCKYTEDRKDDEGVIESVESSPAMAGPSADPSRVSLLSDGSFVSARSSLNGSDEDQFLSLENLNEVGVGRASPYLEGRKIRHRKRPSALSQELKAMVASQGKDSVDAPFYDPLANSAYKDVVASCSYKGAVLYIPLKKRRTDADGGKKTETPHDRRQHLQKQQELPGSPILTRAEIHTDTRSMSSRDTQSLVSAPLARKQLSKQVTQAPKEALRLRIPVLMPLSERCVPSVVQKGLDRGTKERRKRTDFAEETDENKLAVVSLSLSVNGKLSVTISPPFLSFIERVTWSIGSFFEQRSAPSILDAVSTDSNGTVQSHISKLLEDSFDTQPSPEPPLLHLAVSMPPGAFVALQLLQAPLEVPPILRKPPPKSSVLKELIPHSSLVTCYLSGLRCNALIETSTEVQYMEGKTEMENNDRTATTSAERGSNAQSSGKAKSRSLLSSVKVSVKAQCPVLQASVSALVTGDRESPGAVPLSTLPTLPFSQQSQINYLLVIPGSQPSGKPESDEKIPPVKVCNLLEMGIRDASVTCVAKVIHSEVSEDSILTWSNVRSYHLTDPASSPKSEDFETKNNKVVVHASLPSLWTQLASPHTGIPNSSTGGLDLLILSEAIDAWKPGVEHLINMGQLALEKKENRDERVLLVLLSNTARIALCKKELNPLLSKSSSSLRQSVVYNCMLQLWRSLPGYSEAQLASLPEDHSYEEEIVAATLALATRLYSQLETVGPVQIQQQLPRGVRDGAASRASSSYSRRRFRVQHETESMGSVGYLSISPSPSELAMPNIGMASPHNLEFVDFDQLASNVNFEKFVVVRESVIPFLNVAGIRVDPQLRTVCHNSAEFFVDFTVELREATAFIAESTAINVQPPTPKAHPPPPGTPRRQSSSSDLPVLYIEQFVITGCLKYSSESSFQKTPTLSLLVKKTMTEEGMIERFTKSKTNVSAQCCINLETLSGSVTVPAMKFARHMVEMNKFRAFGKDKKREKPAAADAEGSEDTDVKLLVVPATQRTLFKVRGQEESFEVPVDEPDFGRDEQEGEEPASAMNVWAFSQKLLSFFTNLEEQQSLPSLIATTPSLGKVTRRMSHQTSVSSVRSSKPKTIDYSRSPRFPRSRLASSPEKPQQSSPYLAVPMQVYSDSSATGPHETTSITSGEVAINIDSADGFRLSPDDRASAQDTYGGDTTDSPDMDPVLHKPATSSDTEPFLHSSSPNVESFASEPSSSKRSSEYGSSVGGAWFSDTDPLVKSLKLSERELLFSVFGLLRINTVKLGIQVETTSASLELMGISGAVDVRKAASSLHVGSTRVAMGGVGDGERGEGKGNGEEGEKGPLMAESIPTYFSLSTMLKKSLLKISDQGLRDSEIALLSGHPIYCSVGVCNSIQQPVPAYRCLLKLLGLELDVKQPPMMVHKRYQSLMPAFTRIYNDVFAPSNGEPDPAELKATTPNVPGAPVVNVTEMKMPAKLPQGLVHLSLDKVALYVAPLPSLSVAYSVAPVRAQVETSPRVNFSFELGEHSLKFNPRDPKDELAMRTISLPTATLKGDVRSSRRYKLPKVSVDLAVKQVNIDLTTDVLNQLLIVQVAFIKELNELLQLFMNIRESIPRRQRLASATMSGQTPMSSQTSETDLLSLLDSFKLVLLGITITVSTPLSTALRFNTGKIDMLVSNTGNLVPRDPALPSKSQLSLSRKVEIDISLALGYLQDSGPDVVDDFCELAYFRTKISIRNTHQTTRLSDPVAEDQPDFPLPADTFLISIQSPHLYIQSNAVEQGIRFWLNCKSVYSYWQNEKKQLNEGVQLATENFMNIIQKPTQLQAPSIDFSKRRLVKISVTDLGLCMPLIPMSSTPHSAQKSFPATVLTIKDMQLSLNLSHKVASTGTFSGFCLRFAEQFYLRHKTWTMDPKKHKFSNCTIVNTGTLKLCLATKNRYSEVDPAVIVGEKLIWAFQWDMSGIDIYANTTVGRHISTMVKTVTTIGSHLEGRQDVKKSRSSSTLPVPKPQPPKMRRAVSTPRSYHHHRRAMSLTVPSKHTAALEQDLALHTKKVTKLRYSGATGESLKFEEDALRLAEHTLTREVGRMFRRKRVSLQRLNQIFSPRALSVESSKGVERRGSLRRQLSKGARTAAARARRKLFGHSEKSMHPAIAEETAQPEIDQDLDTIEESEMRPRADSYSGEKPSHKRVKSDITDDIIQYMRMEEGQGGSPTLLSPVTSPTSEGPYPTFEGMSEDEGRPESAEEVFGDNEDKTFPIPAIDVEVNVTINVESGLIILRTEESPEGVDSSERRSSIPMSKIHSPHVLSKVRHTEVDLLASGSFPTSKHTPSAVHVDSVLRIPALKVRFHYKSIDQNVHSMTPSSVPRPNFSPEPIQIPPSDTQGRSSPSKLQKSVSWAPQSFADTVAEPPQPEEASPVLTASPAPTKRGVLSLSAVVASVPENLELTPSLLEFIEQVARPAIAATAVTSSSGTDSDSTDIDSETEGVIPAPQTPGESSPLSFPVDVTIAFQIQPSTVYLTCHPPSRVQCMIQSPNVSFVVSFSLYSKREFDNPSIPAGIAGQEFANKVVTFNNLYITGCLTTFALQLFSPQVSSLSATKHSRSFTPKMENREALSLTLGQALIHLSRKSVLAPSTKAGKGVKSVDDYTLHSKLQVSVNTNIASLVVGYDMRRLNDITAFRRYWYRTSLVEALFIGSKKHGDIAGDQLGTPPTSGEDTSSTEPSHIGDMDDSISAAIAVRANVEDFRFSANVAQVMGNTNLVVTHLNLELHMDISHNELVLMNLDACIEKGEVDARGGVVAGNILMEDAFAHLTTDSLQGNIPDHTGSASVHLIEGRVDYMSAPIMLGRASELRVDFSDSWQGLQLGEVASAEDASILILADFSWDELQLSIHRSTTKSMFSIMQKMQEFIAQQQKRSERTISLMLPAGSAASRALAQYRKEKKEAEEKRGASKEDLRHHWLWAMKVGSMDLMRTLGIHTPESLHNVSLGGTITIKGKNICIVCFHGTSFRDIEWGVFNIDFIHASFSTRAIPGLSNVANKGQKGFEERPTCQQICTLQLGTNDSRSKELAAVYRVSAPRVPPITGTNINDWLGYACIDYHLHMEKYESVTEKQFMNKMVKFSRKLSIQPVLLVPALTVTLTNDHYWPLTTPEDSASPDIPVVRCSLISKFSEGISVTTTVDHYLFLHDLITAYIEYLEKHKTPMIHTLTPGTASPSATATPEPQSKESTAPHRQFVCTRWELDPHLLLLSAVSGTFNPHINWLLEKLGFTHARTTIPKWIQRGAMDPMDMAIAKLLEFLVLLTGSKKLQKRTTSPPPVPDV